MTKGQLQELIENQANQHEEDFHKFYPDGTTVAPYCNRDIPGSSFESGAMLLLPSLMVAMNALEKISAINQDIQDAPLEVLYDTNECADLWEKVARCRRKAAEEALQEIEEILVRRDE